MTTIRLEPTSGDDPEFKAALINAKLPTVDIGDEGRLFFKAIAENGAVVGYSGIETCSEAILLRSLVVLPQHRNRGLGRVLTRLTLDQASHTSDIYLATTTAARFFEGIGFAVVDRSDLPETILTTRQLSGICPTSAIIMKLTRPPT